MFVEDFETIDDPMDINMQMTGYEDKVFKKTLYFIRVEVGADFEMKAETKKTLDEFKAFHVSVSFPPLI